MNATDRGEVDLPPSCEVKIWHAPAAKEGAGRLEAFCERLLADDERARAERFRLATSRNQHIVGRAMARHLLSDRGTEPSSIRFEVGSHGKPFVAWPQAVKQPFNIAHTDGLVLCGIADGQAEAVGVDVEPLNRRTTTELADRYFSEPEIAFLRELHEPDRRAAFLRIWTLKESFIKAIGTGLYTPLADFAFHNILSESPSIEFLAPALDDGKAWRFRCFQPREGFVASVAVAMKTDHVDVNIEGWAFEDLVQDGLG